MRLLAYLMFVGGLLVAALCAAKLPPSDKADFPDTWPLCLTAASVAVVGLILWRREDHATYSAGEAIAIADGTRISPATLLRSIVDLLDDLQSRFDTMEPDERLANIEDLLQNGVAPLVDSRRAIIDQLGLRKGSEVLVAAAVGERMLNRTWSAAADGHLDESRSSALEAQSAFQEARQLFHNLTTGESPS